MNDDRTIVQFYGGSAAQAWRIDRCYSRRRHRSQCFRTEARNGVRKTECLVYRRSSHRCSRGRECKPSYSMTSRSASASNEQSISLPTRSRLPTTPDVHLHRSTGIRRRVPQRLRQPVWGGRRSRVVPRVLYVPGIACQVPHCSPCGRAMGPRRCIQRSARRSQWPDACDLDLKWISVRQDYNPSGLICCPPRPLVRRRTSGGE